MLDPAAEHTHGVPKPPVLPGQRAPTPGNYLLGSFPPGAQAARRDGRPRGQVLGDGHELLALDVHGLPVPGHGLGAAADELQGGQPACGEGARGASSAPGPRGGQTGPGRTHARPVPAAPSPAGRPSPGSEPLTPPPRRDAPQRRHLCAEACGKTADRRCACAERTRGAVRGDRRPAPSGASRLLATGTLRPALPPEPGNPPVPIRGSLGPPFPGAGPGDSARGSLCLPDRRSQPHGPLQPRGLCAPPGGPLTERPQPRSPVPSDPLGPQVSVPHRLSTLSRAESSGASTATPRHPPHGPRKGCGARPAPPRHSWAAGDPWG